VNPESRNEAGQYTLSTNPTIPLLSFPSTMMRTAPPALCVSVARDPR
jgi:hypothetical protein